MDDDEIVIKPEYKTIKAKIILDRPDGKIKYFDLLTKIKNKEIMPHDYLYVDDDGINWIWSADINGLMYIEKSDNIMCDNHIIYIDDKYDDLDLVDLLLTIVEKTDEKNIPKYKATQTIIKMLEKCYIDLDMEIDCCQGCMANLDEAFEELKIYAELVKFLGGDIKAHFQELVDQWYKDMNEKEKEEQEAQAKRDAIIKTLPFPIMDLMHIDDKVRDVLWQQNDKINEICKLLQDNKTNKNINAENKT